MESKKQLLMERPGLTASMATKLNRDGHRLA